MRIDQIWITTPIIQYQDYKGEIEMILTLRMKTLMKAEVKV